MKNKLEPFMLGVGSFLATWAIMRIGNLSATNDIAFLFFTMCYVFLAYVRKGIKVLDGKTTKNHKKIAIILSVVFTLFYISDTNLIHNAPPDWFQQ